METVLKNSVSNNYYGEPGQSGSRSPSADVLKELSDSRYTVFDVLPAFFSHSDALVSLGRCFFPLGALLSNDIYSRFRGLRPPRIQGIQSSIH